MIGPRIREACHEVELPDLFNSHTFSIIKAGMEYADSIGEDLIAGRTVAGYDAKDTELVLERILSLLARIG